jgi:hypothetical protein
MTSDGPIISQILLNGVMDKQGPDPALQDFMLYRPRDTTGTELARGGAGKSTESGH